MIGRWRRRQRFLSAVLVVAAVCLLAACSSGGSSSAGGNTAAGSDTGPAKVTFGLTGGPEVYEASHFAAMQNGTLPAAAKKFGSTIVQENFGSGPTLLAALASGSADFILLGAQNVLGLNEKGQGLVGLAVLSNGGQTVLVGAKKYESTRGSDLSKYNGARWGFTVAGSQGQAECIAMAEKAGLNWSNQKGIAVGTISAFLPALQSGKVDLVDMDPSSAARAVDEGVGYVIANTQAPAGIYPYQASGMTLIAKKSFVQQYPALTKAITQAELAGTELIAKDDDNPAAVLSLMPADFKSANQADWTTMWSFMKPAYTGLTGQFSSDVVSQAESFARLQFQIPASTTLDTSVLTNAYQ